MLDISLVRSFSICNVLINQCRAWLTSLFADSSGFVTFSSAKRAQELVGTIIPLSHGIEAELKFFAPQDESLMKSDAAKIRSLLKKYAVHIKSPATLWDSKGAYSGSTTSSAWSKPNPLTAAQNSDGLEAFPQLGSAPSSSHNTNNAPQVIHAKNAAAAAPKKVASKPAVQAPISAASVPKPAVQKSVASAAADFSSDIVGGRKVDVRVVTDRLENTFPVDSQTTFTLLVFNDTSSTKLLQSVTMDSGEWKSDVKILKNIGVGDFGQKMDGEQIGPQRSLSIDVSLRTPKKARIMILKFTFKFQHRTIKHKVQIIVVEEEDVPIAPIVMRPQQPSYRPDYLKRTCIRYDPSEFISVRVIQHDTFPGADTAYLLTDDIQKRLQPLLNVPLGSPVWPDRELYKSRMHDLLWMEEMEQNRLLRKFDLAKTTFALEEDPRFKDCLYSLEVPSLSERRPTVAVGDSLFAWVVGTNDYEYEAYVVSVKQALVVVAFPKAFHNIWSDAKLFTVRFGMTRHTFVANHRSVDLVDLNVVWPVSRPSTSSNEPKVSVDAPHLADKRIGSNRSQMKALNLGLNRRETFGQNFPLLIFGPFGTGKTQTLVELAYQSFTQRKDSRILICTLSNSAADIVASRLVSIGAIAGSPNNLLRLYASTRKLEQIHHKLQPFTYSDPKTGEFTVPPHISSYRIVVVTCANAVRIQHLPKGHFSHIIVDEAAQLLEAEVLHPLSLANQNTSIVMAGDPMQLTHRSQSRAEALNALSLSIMDRLTVLDVYSKYDDTRSAIIPVPHNWIDLKDNYRSHPVLLDYCSQHFYGGALHSKIDPSTLPRLGEWEALEDPDFPLVYAPCIGVEQLEDDSPSFFNFAEARLITLLIQDLLNDPCASNIKQEDIGVITPFFKQNMMIRKMLRMVGKPHVTVSSINDLQGREFQAVFVSTVRSSLRMVQEDAYQGFGFINNPQALNTVMSRARSLVVIVGHPLPIRFDEALSAYATACEEHGSLFGRWPTPQELDKMLSDDDRYATLVTRVGDTVIDRANIEWHGSAAAPSPSAPQHDEPVVQPNRSSQVPPIGPPPGTHIQPIGPPGASKNARMDNAAPSYHPSSSGAPLQQQLPPFHMPPNHQNHQQPIQQQQNHQHSNGTRPPIVRLQEPVGKALTVMGERPFLVKRPEFDAPDALVMNNDGKFEVHIASLGYLPEILQPRAGLLVVQLAPVEAHPPHTPLLWTSTAARPLLLEVHQPELATHFNIERSFASIKITYYHTPNITPGVTPQTFTPM